jgi:DNA-directed RNA polymerase, mitochondrial
LTVQNLYAQKLADFINETSWANTQKIPKSKRIKKLISSTSNPQYNKYPVELMQTNASSLHLGDIRDPAIFINPNDDLNFSKETMDNIIDSYQAFRIDPDLESHEEATEAVEEEILQDENDAFESNSVKPIIKKKKQSKQYNGKYFSDAKHERLAQKQSLTKSLNAYVDCCVTNGMVNRGLLTLLNFRSKYARYPLTSVKIEDVNIYNRLIHGYAEKENIQKCRELLTIIQDDRIKPNEQTFANFLECIGRISENPLALQKNQMTDECLIENVQELLKQAEMLHISPNDIVDKSIFISDQREAVLKAIRMVLQDFNPVYTPPDILYRNELLNVLNENVQDISMNPLENLNTPVPGNEIMASKSEFQRDEITEFGRQQLEAELYGYVSIPSVQKFPEPTEKVLTYRKKLEELYKQWKEQISTSFNRELNTLRQIECTKPRGEPNLLPYLRALDVDDYTDILLHEVRIFAEGSESFSPTVLTLFKTLGRKVETRYHKEQRKKNGILQKTGEIYGNYTEILAAGNSSDNTRQIWQRLMYHNQIDEGGPSMNFIDTPWPVSAQIGVGKFFYNILMRDLKIDSLFLMKKKNKINSNMIPAFYTIFRHQAKVVKEEVKPHPILIKLFKGSQQETLTFEVNQVPMLCPPQPWTSAHHGGYLIEKTDLIRLPPISCQQTDQIDSTPIVNLYPSFDSLNQLASTPWTVNNDVLDVVLEVFNNGGNHKIDVPEPPESLKPPERPENMSTLEREEKFEYLKQRMMHRRRQSEMYSLWCDALYRLSLANYFRNRVFWLPHNMDFRGRVYPVPPHFNHLGADLARSLLIFHQKKKLGLDGLMWLKLHCVNLTGLKKRDSVRERLLYAEAIMDKILDSADNPLNGHQWWTQSDEPWQTLACCKEIAKAIRSGDPENYESSFPIHQDGSCNGLQHYAALGRDSAGAISVNLAPADVPQDVYSGIANLVEKARAEDEKNGVEIARILNGFIRRKVIKQTVMTTVYGVTKYGARLQIQKQLKDIEEFPQEYVWQASQYLTNKTFESLQEMFTSTKEIQDWFTSSAKMISSICGQSVHWITPLGLPVVQPYTRKSNIGRNPKFGSKTNDSFSKPNTLKQTNAFPPNFIHSLDSSHMMLTSLFCERAGITYVSVHDCFWTHPSSAPDMNKICRDQFLALHQLPILEDLSQYLITKYQYRNT